jgi:hypothetical protein
MFIMTSLLMTELVLLCPALADQGVQSVLPLVLLDLVVVVAVVGNR